VGETLPQGAREHATLQLTPCFAGSPETVAKNGAFAPTATVAVPGITETVIPRTVTFAVPFTAESVAEDAVIVTTMFPAGGVVGAVYVVLTPAGVVAGETLPQGGAEQETLQLTPWLAPSLVTVDPKVAVPPGCSCCVPEVSETDTVNDGTVTVAKADFVGSPTEVATRLTVN